MGKTGCSTRYTIETGNGIGTTREVEGDELFPLRVQTFNEARGYAKQ